MKKITVNEENKEFRKGDRVLLPARVINTIEQNGRKRVNIRTQDKTSYGIYGEDAISNLLLVVEEPQKTAETDPNSPEEFKQLVADVADPAPDCPKPSQAVPSVRDHNVGKSDYAKHKIQPWDIWLEYGLDPWDADIVKRVLRVKDEPGMTREQARVLDYQKIIHICEEKIRQLTER